MKTQFVHAIGAAAIGAALLGTAPAQAAGLPQVRHSGAVEYLSGGIGHDEAAAIEAASAHWPVTMEFAVRDGKRSDFAADVKVEVRDAKGHVALDTRSDGPFLLARLQPGSYTVHATLRERTLRQALTVSRDKPSRVVFVWPAGTDERSG
ncbi:MAG: carboxypeptidase-like regulatory domain-containing protein [Burkholderiaceae bacterium]|nr:carboxypeptidase-like regulatory domain-containing protein [Burkholderiaceae bacterium]